MKDDRQVAQSEVLFSYIPMSSAIDLSTDKAIHDGDVRYVWEGNLNPQEKVISDLPRILPLGDEYITATNRNDEGSIYINSCTLVVDVYRQQEWAGRNLGEPTYELMPRIFEWVGKLKIYRIALISNLPRTAVPL